MIERPTDECEECGSGIDDHEEWCSEGMAMDDPEDDEDAEVYDGE